jgi:hypothetical protein
MPAALACARVGVWVWVCVCAGPPVDRRLHPVGHFCITCTGTRAWPKIAALRPLRRAHNSPSLRKVKSTFSGKSYPSPQLPKTRSTARPRPFYRQGLGMDSLWALGRFPRPLNYYYYGHLSLSFRFSARTVSQILTDAPLPSPRGSPSVFTFF